MNNVSDVLDDCALGATTLGHHDATDERVLQLIGGDAQEAAGGAERRLARARHCAAALVTVQLLLEHHVAEVQHTGDDGVDLHLLRVAHAQRRHGLVGEREVAYVVQLDVAKTAVLQELSSNAGLKVTP